MVAEIVCVGTELLLGDIVNTNAQHISKELAHIGIDLYYQTVVGDNKERVWNVLDTALKRSDLIIMTGGLGPTKDDLTKEVAASFFGKKLVFHEQTYEHVRKKLESYGLYTMGDIARCSIGKPMDAYNEDLLYKLFGINAELLIDHAWGYEPCPMKLVKAYKPETNSVSSGQVLHCPCDFEQTKLIVKEMADLMVLDLVDKGVVTDQIVLTIGYDIENLTDPNRRRNYRGPVVTDHYGRQIPKHAHGTTNLKKATSSTMLIMDAVVELYDRIVDPSLLIRRITLTANRLVDESSVKDTESFEQLNLFTDYITKEKEQAQEKATLDREKKIQQAMLDIKKKFGKNAILRGMNLQEGATARDRNEQIGGHKA